MSPTMLSPLLLALVMVTSVRTADKYVAFEMSPTEVFPHCTPLMMLRCSVNSTSSTTHGMGSLGETEVTVANVHWNALIIKKEGVAIASVTYSDSVDSYTPANVYDNSTSIAVGGSLLSSEEECGFLEVTWTDPMFSLNGTYECVANGLDTVGNQHSFSVTAGVIIGGATEAHMDALKQHISELEASLKECEAPTTAVIPETPTMTIDPLLPAQFDKPIDLICEPRSPITSQPYFSFYRNGVLFLQQGSRLKTLDVIQMSENGDVYTCTLELKGQVSSMSNSLTLVVVGFTTLTASPSDPTDGDDVFLTCGHYPQTDDITSYEFFKDDVSLMDSASATYSLTPLTYPDDGVFTCVAKAGASAYVESNEADLTLIPKTTTIEFESGLFAKANLPVTLVCLSSSTITSQPAYTFYRNGVSIAHGGSYGHTIDGIQTSENGAVFTCTLTLKGKESSMSEGLTMFVIDICETYADRNNADPESCSNYYTCAGGKVSAGPITCPNSALFNRMFGECDENMTECF